MRLRVSMILSLACLALLAAACSGSTVVERADRPAGVQDTSEEADEADEPSDDAPREAATVAPLEDPDASEGFGLGGSEQLVGLTDDCQADNDQACDILFFLAAFDSTEEAIAQDCGGRGEPDDGFCTDDVMPLEDTLAFDEASDALPDIAEDCEEGDLTACDFLFFRSPVGSSYQELGNSCGGRIEAAAPDCRIALADG